MLTTHAGPCWPVSTTRRAAMLATRFFYVRAGLLCALALLVTPPSAQAEGGYVYLT